MAYKSLYRKYRPNTFDDVYGQEFIIKTLKNSLQNKKICHAYLFSGSRGTGKTTVAKIFARMVNCLNPKENMPCGNCEICKNENTDEIQDIIEIDAASNNGVDEIRELKNKIKLVPVLCKYKVYIIDEVHMLSTGAFNALLKTLEEPPEHVIFILATTEPQKLPVTIISRCQRFDFKRITLSDIENRLLYISQKENIKISSSAIAEIALISDGALRDAIGILDQVSSFSDKTIEIDDIYIIGGNVSYTVLKDLIEAYLNNELEKILNIIETIYLEGKDFSKLTEKVLYVFRNMLICKKASEYFKTKDTILKEWIFEKSSNVNDYELKNAIENFEQLSREIKFSNYPRILFELYMLKGINENIEPIKIEDEKKTLNKKEPEKINNDIYIKQKEIKLEENKTTNEIKINFDTNCEYKKALVNNTIALSNNESKKQVQSLLDEIDNYIVNKKYKIAATILKDAKIAAASEDHLLLTYKYDSMVENNDKEINKIKSFLADIIKKDFIVVALTDDDWKIERPYYIEQKKTNGKIELLEETIPLENFGGGISAEKKDVIVEEAIDMFGKDLIEME